MKIIKTFDDDEFPISDKFFDGIEEKMKNNNFLRLEDGSVVNVKSIASIAEPPTESWWKGHKLSKSGDSFMRDGVRVFLEGYNYSEVTQEMSDKHYKWSKSLGEDGLVAIERSQEDDRVSQFAGELSKKFNVSQKIT